ncbi:MAG: phosphoadenosine phosphosulfate reductase family protein, partial [Thermoflexales bacterium]|nr:phosphoadenosine phosphosulfate reductase family protein [Thermoflexales bacterium]
GKDSTALAIYLRDRIPELEYVFCDTGEELPETYEYLDRLQSYLGKESGDISAAMQSNASSRQANCCWD